MSIENASAKFPESLYKWQLGFTALLLISLFFTKFLLSISMIGLLLTGMAVAWNSSKTAYPDFWNRIKEALLQFFTKGIHTQSPHFPKPIAFLGLIVIFVLIAFSGLYSADLDFWATRTRIALPFLALSLAFLNLRPYRHRDFIWLSALFIVLVISTSLASYLHFTYFQTNTDEILGSGGSIPVPIHHIRFGLFLCVAVILSAYFVAFAKVEVSPLFKRLFVFSFFIAFFLIHLLAVRSAIAGLYGSLFLMMLIWIIRSGKIKVGMTAMALMCIIPLAGYFIIPGFQQKVNYTLSQIPKIQSGELKNLSDGERLASIVAGLEATAEAPWFGHGYGDIQTITSQKYAASFPELNPKLPHNQWIFWSTGLGILGAFICTLAMFCPFLFHSDKWEGLFAPFFSLVLISCLVEATFETAHGVAFFVFFAGFLLRAPSFKD
jgi:O-antigen ligase